MPRLPPLELLKGESLDNRDITERLKENIRREIKRISRATLERVLNSVNVRMADVMKRLGSNNS